ncbi:MAG: hypothetical protein IIX77_04880 [Oscillospiraceae bacterium]|nr:hypothetical protein [Oscillospiraceae bacterium]
MELNYVKDHLFDLLNESDLLDVSDIICDDKKGTFEIVVHDGDRFLITCEEIKA